MVGDDLVKVREARAALEAHDAARAPLLAVSDEAIGTALENGNTWEAVREAAGLSRRGLQIAVGRYRSDK